MLVTLLVYLGSYCISVIVSYMPSADRGVIYKVAQWRPGSGRIHFITVAVLRPFRHVVRPIWQMLLHTTPDNEVCGRHRLAALSLILVYRKKRRK